VSGVCPARDRLTGIKVGDHRHSLPTTAPFFDPLQLQDRRAAWRLLPLIAMTLLVDVTTAQAAPVYRDLNHNGRLDPYEDSDRPIEARVEDILKRMTLEEKVGAMMHGSLPSGDPLGQSGNSYDVPMIEGMVRNQKVNSFITRLSVSPGALARQNNKLQKMAEESRLGIPLTISTDPRNHFQAVFGASTKGGGFSLWPETLGFATFGASDAAVLDVVTGRVAARGTLPFELPATMEAVDGQDPARPDDSVAPLFPRSAGLSIAEAGQP